MADVSAVQARVDSATNRFDNVISEFERRQRRQWAAEDAERERAQAERVRAQDHRKRQYQAIYADAYRMLGTEPPLPLHEETSLQFRTRLYDGLRRRLAPDHELASIRSDDVCGQRETFENFEARLLEAARLEGETPSEGNLPPAGEFVARQRVDPDSGEKRTEYYGKESFIRGLSRPASRVSAFLTHRGAIVFGRPGEGA